METSIKKRYPILIILTAILVSAAVFFVVYRVCLSNKERDNLSIDSFRAIPTDASSILFFSSIDAVNRNISLNSPLFGDLLFGSGQLRPFFERLYSLSSEESLKDIRTKEVTISSHYSAKNQVSSLMAAHIDDINPAFLTSTMGGNSKRIYSGVAIYGWKGIDFAFYNGFLLASPSPIILESSIRHIQAGNSIADQDQFAKLVSGTYLSDLVAFINHSQTGKLFSGYAERRYLKYSDFVSNLCSWSSYHFSNSSGTIMAEGDFAVLNGAAQYLSVFYGASGAVSKAQTQVPFNTFALLTLTLKDFSGFVKMYEEHKGYYRKGGAGADKKAVEWFEDLDVKELSFALIPYGGELHGITLLRTSNAQGAKFRKLFGGNGDVPEPLEFPYKGVLQELFGGFFGITREDCILESGEWIIVGPEQLLSEYAKGTFGSFTMEEFMEQTKARNLFGNGRNLLSLTINSSFMPDSLTRFFRKEVRRDFNNVYKKSNLSVTAFHLTASGNGYVKGGFFSFADSADKMPVSTSKEVVTDAGWEVDTLVRVPAGPFPLISFENGEREYLEQLPNLWLRLNDKNMKGIWSVPFQENLRGYVQQIDYYRNGKLQMLFASSKKLFLLDRTGRYVHPFPLSIADTIVLGPKVFDPASNGGIAIMLLHPGNILRLYDKSGNTYPAWSDISVDETIKEFPELVEVGNNKYWILRTALATHVYTINGNAVTNSLRDKYRLRHDTPLIPAGGSLVKARTISDTDILLNLETGKYNRIR